MWRIAVPMIVWLLLAATGVAAQDEPDFTPINELARLVNAEEVAALISRNAAAVDVPRQPWLMAGGAAGGAVVEARGVVHLWVFVEASGEVGNARLDRLSEASPLGPIVLDAVPGMRFRPAQYRGESVSAWLRLPVLVSGDPVRSTRADAVHALILSELLERGEGWWGYPAPAEYCLAIASGHMLPSMAESRDPSRAVLDEVQRAHPGRTFHPASRCSSGGYPVRGPSGKAAGLLWVAPFDATDGLTLEGGWSVQRDMTTWECSLDPRVETIELRGCSLLGETEASRPGVRATGR